METQYTNDEIDLRFVLKKIKDFWRKTLVRIFKFLKYQWQYLLLLILIGVGLGLLIQYNSGGKFQSVLLIQNNFESTNYVYDAVQKLKTKTSDTFFREKYGLKPDTIEILDIQISPVINIIDLIEKSDVDSRVLEQYLSEADFQEDLLLSEAYINEYKYHRLTIDFTADASPNTINAILDYLNDNEYFLEAKDILIQETKSQIKNHQRSIEGIDAVFFSYKDTSSTKAPSQFIFENKETVDLHLLLKEKSELLKTISDLKTDLLKLDNIIYVINDPTMIKSKSPVDKLHFILPLFFVFSYVVFSWLKKTYLSLKPLIQEKKD